MHKTSEAAETTLQSLFPCETFFASRMHRRAGSDKWRFLCDRSPTKNRHQASVVIASLQLPHVQRRIGQPPVAYRAMATRPPKRRLKRQEPFAVTVARPG